MRRLYISIIVAIFGSLFAISWGIEQLVSENITREENPEILLYRQIIEGVAQQLSDTKLSNIEQLSSQLSQQYQIDLLLKQARSVALPKSLHQELSQSGGLLLASESENYLLKQLEGHPQFLVQLLMPSESNKHQNIDIFLTSLLYLGVCFIVVLWLLPLTRRLYLLTSAAAKIGEGQLDVRVPSSKLSYIHTLESNFNRMATQIEKLIADNKILARSLSHDIRTPMSCLRFGVEAALDSKSIEKKDEYIHRMESELTRMEDMTSAFLEYAGMERKGFNSTLTATSINAFITQVTDEFQSMAEHYNITLTCSLLPQDKQCMLDKHWFFRAMQNLLSNAVQYAQKNVSITLSQHAQFIQINVEDDGKGLPEDKLNTIFDPFIKLDDNRSREDGHFGLGLAIAAKVMGWHHGRISATNSRLLSGACFSLFVPLKR